MSAEAAPGVKGTDSPHLRQMASYLDAEIAQHQADIARLQGALDALQSIRSFARSLERATITGPSITQSAAE